MSKSVTYDKLFRITNCGLIIFFEDDYSFDNDKKVVFYGLSRINLSMRNRLLGEIKEKNGELFEKIVNYCTIIDKYESLINWEEIPQDDIEIIFNIISEKGCGNDDGSIAKKIYDETGCDQIKKIASILNQYGIGIKVPIFYKDIFDDYIFKEKRWKAFKLYRDFIAKTKEAFLIDLESGIELEGVITCIIDNQLCGEARAGEILHEIEMFNQERRKNIIGAILSSKEKEEKINDKIFIEYVNKDNPDGIQIALAKSSYSLLLSKLKKVYLNILMESFDEAVSNKDIAYYFAKMASYEGVTSYKVVTDWIDLFFKYKINLNDEVFDIIKLTQLIDIINEDEIEYSEEMKKLNTFEAFDLNVNKYYQPPSAGDIFRDDKGNYYILVGQDCELMVSQTRSGKNAVSELVKATVVEQVKVDKLENNLEYMYINNFREHETEQPKCLEIKYSSREFLDNAIIKLCNFNDNGFCKINLREPLDDNIQDVIPPYLNDSHDKLQKYFNSIVDINNTVGIQFKEFIESEFTQRLKYLLDYKIDSDRNLIFPYQRIARLNRSYVLYLYKLFLEYRGRHPFDCINLTRHASLMLPIIGEKLNLPVDVILSTNRDENRKNCYKQLVWHVNPRELEKIIESIYSEKVLIIQKNILSLRESENTIECENGNKIILKKTKRGADIKLHKLDS